MNILILGSGGREHAFAWKIAQSSSCNKLIIAPGNAGTNKIGTNINININDFNAVKKLVLDELIDMVLVGPETPLVNGIYDFFQQDEDLRKVSIIGPSANGARLEGSKQFAKEFMQRHNIPTAKHKTFTKENINEGYDFLDSLHSPYVLKADGLAAGKGVLILNNLKEAKKALKSMIIDAKFGEASSKVVVEEFLNGIELSVFVITDGNTYKILPTAKDYKRVGERDTGLNTGGMGAVSPVPFADRFYIEKVEREIIKPTLEGLKKENIVYKGFIFFGLINVNGQPKVIEYNVRMGDPETEAVIPRINSDLLNLFKGIDDGTFSERDLHIIDDTAVTVMLVSSGYPNLYQKGKFISGFDQVKDSLLFHAGTIGDAKIKTNGGRVIAVTAISKSMREAKVKAYKDVEKINYDGKFFRKDIGFDL